MLFGTAIPMVSATETTEATYPSYEEAEPGEVLYKVDFKNDTRYMRNTSYVIINKKDLVDNSTISIVD